MQEAQPLSLRDRIRQLEQAAHSPLTDPSASSTRHSTRHSSNGPTSSRRLHNGTAAHSSLPVQHVAHADDPLQQQSSEASRPLSVSSPSVRTSARSAAQPPPPKPPRPVWVTSKARETPTAPLSNDTRAEAEAGQGDRDLTTSGSDPPNATLACSPDAASRGEQSSTQAALKTDSEPNSLSGHISPTTRSKPALPARPPAAMVTSPILSQPPSPPSSVSASSPTSKPVAPSGTGTPAAPALPPRPAWARKASPSGPLPLDESRDSTPAPDAQLGRPDSSIRDPASSVRFPSTSLATFPSAGPLSGSSSPALPPRPRRVPSPAQQNTDTKTSAVVAANARRRYDRLFSQCVEAAATAWPSLGSEERLDGAMIGELWRRSRLDDAVLRRIWNEVASPEHRSSLDRDEFARGMGMIDAELQRRQR